MDDFTDDAMMTSVAAAAAGGCTYQALPPTNDRGLIDDRLPMEKGQSDSHSFAFQLVTSAQF